MSSNKCKVVEREYYVKDYDDKKELRDEKQGEVCNVCQLRSGSRRHLGGNKFLEMAEVVGLGLGQPLHQQLRDLSLDIHESSLMADVYVQEDKYI